MRILISIPVLFFTTYAFAQSSSSASSAGSTSSSTSSVSSSSTSSTSSVSSSSSASSSSSSSSLTPCQTVAECVYDNVPPTVTSCFASTPLCTSDNERQFSTTAEQLADSALVSAKCVGKTWRRKALCNACYRLAKAPLADRFYVKLFKGLLGQAVKVIESRRVEVCGALAK